MIHFYNLTMCQLLYFITFILFLSIFVIKLKNKMMNNEIYRNNYKQCVQKLLEIRFYCY